MNFVRIPVIDANIRAATVVAWRKQVGEKVAEGEALVDLATEKSVFVMDAPASGVVAAIFAGCGSSVPIRYVIGAIGESGEAAPEEPAENAHLMEEYRKAAQVNIAQVAASTVSRIRATPRARRLAAQHGLELADIASRRGVQVVDEAAVQAELEARGIK